MGQIRPQKTKDEQQAHEQHLKAAVANFHPGERARLIFSDAINYSDLHYLQVLADEESISLDQKAREFVSTVMGNRGFVEGSPRHVEIGIRATFTWQRFWADEGFTFEHFEDIINLH